MSFTRPPSTLIVLVLAGLPGRADDSPRADRDVISLRRCEVDYVRSSQVGVALMGQSASILQECCVREGDRVKAGQVLGRVMDRDLRAELEVRRAEAESSIEIQLCEAKHEVTLNRLMHSENLQRRDRRLVGGEEYQLHKSEERTTALEIEQAKLRRRLAKLQLQQTEFLVRAREFLSPHDGVVVEVYKKAGEAISVGEPIFRVVDVDRLKVTGHLNLSDYWRVRKGQRVRIIPEIEGAELAIEDEEFTGVVIFIDCRIDPVSKTGRIITEVENRGNLLASGIEARMDIFAGDAPDPGPTGAVAQPAPSHPAAQARGTPEARPAADAGDLGRRAGLGPWQQR
jgi:multidrug efflux pump subunit AcrA (membrane-fusion protein)